MYAYNIGVCLDRNSEMFIVVQCRIQFDQEKEKKVSWKMQKHKITRFPIPEFQQRNGIIYYKQIMLTNETKQIEVMLIH